MGPPTGSRSTSQLRINSRQDSCYRSCSSAATTRKRGAGQTFDIASDAVDVHVKNGKLIEAADTAGPAQITLNSVAVRKSAATTVITAGKFHAAFDHNRLSGLHGEPNARVVSSTPGQPDKITTSRTLRREVQRCGQIAEIVQEGDFEYHEPAPSNVKGVNTGRSAFADSATYSPSG